jgi:hypothetical protein
MNDSFFTSNPDKILGEVKTRKNRFGKEETYVEGSIENLADLQTFDKKAEVEKVYTEPQTQKLASPVVEKVKTTINKNQKAGKITQVYTPDFLLRVVGEVPEIADSQDVSKTGLDLKEEERKAYENVNRDGSVDFSESYAKYLNYQGGLYYNDINYFSGNISKKLAQLERDKKSIIEERSEEQYEKQKQGLRDILPEEKTVETITWHPLDRHVGNKKFVMSTMRGDIDATITTHFASWVSRKRPALSGGVYTGDITNYVYGRRARAKTQALMPSIESDTKRLYEYFIKNELPENVRNEIVKEYNESKNSYVAPNFDKMPVYIKDMAKEFRGEAFEATGTQKGGVGFLVNKGTGLIAYGVGVGKTHTMLLATVANMQKGNSKRPLFVVPKSTIEKTWINTIMSMFPKLTVVNLGGLTTPEIKRLKNERGEDPAGWIRDGEIGVISHEGILNLGLSEEQMRQAGNSLNDAMFETGNTKRKDEQKKEDIEEIVGKLQGNPELSFDKLGIDHLSVDEIHNFRKVFKGAKKEEDDDGGGKSRFANVIGGTPSKRAQKLFILSQLIQKNNNGSNVFLASATPFENHATEVYNVLSFIASDQLKEMGIFNINDFFSVYADFKTEATLGLNNEVKQKQVMYNYANVSSLQMLMRQFIDYKVDPTLIRPEKKVLSPHLAMTDLQIGNYRRIQAFLAGQNLDPETGELSQLPDEAKDGAYLKASTYSISNAVSPYFIKEWSKSFTPEELIENSPKLKYAFEVIKKNKETENTKDYGTFVYFGKHGVSNGGQDAFAKYVIENLGYKRTEVRVTNGGTSNAERELIKEGFNNGTVKVLIGGDNTKEGIDLQMNGLTTINVALGWNPTEPAQVEGRVWRQGNKRSLAPIIYPLVENSGDAQMYAKFAEKGGRINDLFSYRGEIFDIGEIDPREKKLSLVTDPEAKAELAIGIKMEEERVKAIAIETELDQMVEDKEKLEDYKEEIKENKEYIKSGKDRWGNKLDKAEIKEYKSDLRSSELKLKTVEARIERAGVKDLDKYIEDLEAKLETGKITEESKKEEKKKLVVQFKKEYQEFIKDRKQIEDHITDYGEIIKEVNERTGEEMIALRRSKQEALERGEIKYKLIEEDLTINTLDKLKGRETVSKQFISDLTNSPDLKQVERDLVRKILEEMPETVNVKEFSDKVKMELLPLEAQTSEDGEPAYDATVLEEDLRGEVGEYIERVYESPIMTSAGNVHFGGDTENYFAHTRIEDMARGNYESADTVGGLGSTRRVIEIQSDLFQKGRLEAEKPDLSKPETFGDEGEAFDRVSEIERLEPYRNTWHERIIREEIKQASKDGIQTLQFPVGETAMLIEGLGVGNVWNTKDDFGEYSVDLNYNEIMVGDTVGRLQMDMGGEAIDEWVVTDVLGDGKFKAVPKGNYDVAQKRGDKPEVIERLKETFDVSGKIEESNPIYKFYENTVSKYLKRVSPEVIRVTDDQGVEWFEIPITKEQATAPVKAFKTDSVSSEYQKQQAIDFLTDFKNRLNISFPVYFVDRIISDMKIVNPITKKTKGFKDAYGLTADKAIALIPKDAFYTAKHEVVHLTLDSADDIAILKRNGITKEKVLQAKAKQMGVELTKLNMGIVEENLAQDFEAYGDNKLKPKGIIKRFFHYLDLMIGRFLDAITKSNGDLITNYFDILLEGKEVGNRITTLESKGIIRSFIVDGILDARKIEEALVEAKARAKNIKPMEAGKANDIFNSLLLAKTSYERLDILDKLSDKDLEAFSVSNAGNMATSLLEEERAYLLEGQVPPNRKFKLIEENDKYYKKVKKQFNELTEKEAQLEENARMWEEELESKILEKQFSEEMSSYSDIDKVKGLVRYTIKGGVLPEVTGGDAKTKFGKYGDDIVTEHGFESSEEAREAMEDYLIRKQEIIVTRNKMSALRRDIAQARKETKATKSALRDIERRLKLRKEMLERKDYYVTMGIKRGQESALKAVSYRRRAIAGIQEAFNISDAVKDRVIGKELKGQRIHLMKEEDFNDFLIRFSNLVQLERARLTAQDMVKSIQQFSQFEKIDNLRLALGLPVVDQMTEFQANTFIDALSKYEFGDVFLSKRVIETIHRTNWGEIATERELINKASEVTGATVEQIKNSHPVWSDLIKNDTLIAKKDPFYNWLVTLKHTAMIQATAEFATIENEVDNLTKKARKSRRKQMGIGERIVDVLVPTDEIVFNYIEDTEKEVFARKNNMTPEELTLANYLIGAFGKARDYLMSEYGMKERQNFITHRRRKFLEILKTEKSVWSAVRELYTSAKEDEQAFKILNDKTGDILAFEKFFGSALQRTGKIIPTLNIAKSSKEYFRELTKKKALDQLIPEVMVVANFIDQGKPKTEKGLIKELSTAEFIKKYLNLAKGRKFDFGGFLPQGGAVDIAIKGLTGIVYYKFLALSIAVQVASYGGEFISNMRGMTYGQRVKFFTRILNFKKNARISKQIVGVTGRNPVVELLGAENSIVDILSGLMFIGFSHASYKSTRDYFRAVVTDEEYNSGLLSKERITEIELLMNKFRLSPNYGKSIVGATSLVGAINQFKTWALPHLTSTTSEVFTIAKDLKNKPVGEALTSTDAKSLVRGIELTASAFVLVTLLSRIDYDDDEVPELVKVLQKKVLRELLTLQQMLGIYWGSWGLTPATLSFFGSIQDHITELVKMEKYVTDGKGYKIGELKGVQHLKEDITPTAVKQFLPPKEYETSKTGEELIEFEKKKEGEERVSDYIKQNYKGNTIVDIILEESKNDNRVAKMLEYAKEVGTDQAYTELKTLYKDKNLCNNQDKNVGCLVSGQLFKQFKIAKDKL